jgi:HSP20 family protein
MATLLVRREPIDSLVDEFFNDFFNRAAAAPQVARNGELSAAVRARMDVLDKGDRYEVLVDLPGVKKEDIQVTVEGPRVSIAAESKSEKESKQGERVLHSERLAASYARSFELPAEVTEAGAQATFENGVLKLALPKRAAATSRKIAIH